MYHSLNTVRVIKSRRLRWEGHIARMQEGRRTFKILTGTPAVKRPLGRPRSRWEDNIRMDLKEIGINMRNWVDLAQDTDSGTCTYRGSGMAPTVGFLGAESCPLGGA